MLSAVLAAFTVVLDAGHGGSNLGAQGVEAHVHEKRLTLAVARLVETRLRARGVKVFLTRRTDTLLTLRERVRRANAWAPDLFVSLHFNASPDRSQRGSEAYVLDPAGAALEVHRAGVRAGGDEPGAAAQAAQIRAEHAQDHARTLAWEAARGIQRRVCGALAEASGVPRASLDRGVRAAALDVLRGATAPAVLAEIAFIDHPLEGREILRPRVQAELADAVAQAIAEVGVEARRGRAQESKQGESPVNPRTPVGAP